MKIVKLEALGQRCLYRVLDLYSHLQSGACPEGASRILRGLRCQNSGEEAAREAAESREQQHATRALHFLQLHHREGSLLKGLNAQAEAELRKIRAQFRLEIQIHTEEKGLVRKSSLAKDFQLEAQRTRLGGEKKGKMEQNSQNSQIPGTHPKAEDQLLQFLTKSIKVLKQAEHLMASRITLLNPQLTAPPLHGDEMKCETSSFLLGLLQEVNDELRRNAGAAGLGQSQRLQKTEICAQEGELSAVDPAALSPREFVVFQYGLSILQFLTFHIQAPEFTLAVASSLPQSDAPGNAFRNSFFYQMGIFKFFLFFSQNSKKKLFILRECLGSGGGFLLVLVHCWAHVTAGDLSHDSNPLFLSLFHQALKACLSEMFSLRLQLSAAAPGNKSQGINQILLQEEPFSTEEINLISQLLEVRVKNLTDVEAFEKDLLLRVKSEESLSNKWLVKKKENFLHPLSSSGRESLGQRAHLEEETVASLSLSELEDKVDALTEELLQIVEDEQQFLSSEGNEDLLSYYLDITSLEKQSLGKQIKALEEEIAQGRNL
ncbi:PREDICTED: uncharacterized protein LOC106858121 [Sturnus vulgaris]|uniref:uncharacterized protein LOC106858121 n=1 Tax=Sturnus vulgaris TaxID=9172 RepID=UPI000719FAC8|nr:PREDICTED: uncharacterized protein LOC106858121 [Sturnus vulgaris]